MAPSDASLSGRAQSRLAILEETRRKWDRVHALVQQIYTGGTMTRASKGALSQSGKDPVGGLMRQLKRQCVGISETLADGGFAPLADDVQQLVSLTRLSGAVQKATLFRMKEVVALGYDGIELAERRVREQDRDDDLLRRAL